MGIERAKEPRDWEAFNATVHARLAYSAVAAHAKPHYTMLVQHSTWAQLCAE